MWEFRMANAVGSCGVSFAPADPQRSAAYVFLPCVQPTWSRSPRVRRAQRGENWPPLGVARDPQVGGGASHKPLGAQGVWHRGPPRSAGVSCPSASCRQDAPPQQIERGPTIHCALDGFQAIHLPLDLAVAEWERERGQNGRKVAPEARHEALQLGQTARICPGQPALKGIGVVFAHNPHEFLRERVGHLYLGTPGTQALHDQALVLLQVIWSLDQQPGRLACGERTIWRGRRPLDRFGWPPATLGCGGATLGCGDQVAMLLHPARHGPPRTFVPLLVAYLAPELQRIVVARRHSVAQVGDEGLKLLPRCAASRPFRELIGAHEAADGLRAEVQLARDREQTQPLGIQRAHCVVAGQPPVPARQWTVLGNRCVLVYVRERCGLRRWEAPHALRFAGGRGGGRRAYGRSGGLVWLHWDGTLAGRGVGGLGGGGWPFGGRFFG